MRLRFIGVYEGERCYRGARGLRVITGKPVSNSGGDSSNVGNDDQKVVSIFKINSKPKAREIDDVCMEVFGTRKGIAIKEIKTESGEIGYFLTNSLKTKLEVKGILDAV